MKLMKSTQKSDKNYSWKKELTSVAENITVYSTTSKKMNDKNIKYTKAAKNFILTMS